MSEDEPFSPKVWLARARSNLALARAGRQIQGVYLEDLCFEAQQAAEKALKALCVHLNLDFPKTHSLASLVDMIATGGIIPPENIRASVILTQYAVHTRYPGLVESVTSSEYETAVLLAEIVVDWVGSILTKS